MDQRQKTSRILIQETMQQGHNAPRILRWRRELCWRFTVTVLAVVACTMSFAQAAPLTPVSYAMQNGDGQAHGGTYNYWDQAYTGAGCTTCDGAPLSGGLGNLTDGVIAAENWFQVENSAGTGPYVGWISRDVPNPSITFHFSTPIHLNAVTLYVDDADGTGGVQVPAGATVTFGALSHTATFLDPLGAAPTSFVVSVPFANAVATDVTVTLLHRDIWVFLSEVQFDGTLAAVPEPATFFLFGAGIMGVLVASRRRAVRSLQ